MSSQFTFDAIGTHWVIDIFDDPLAQKEKLREKIRERIDIFDKNYSRFRADSLVTEMSQKAGEYLLPDDARELFAVYRKMYDITHGLVTPLIGQVLVDAGYDAEYSLTQKHALIKPLAWDEVMTYEHPKVSIHIPALLDFGAAGKGYLIDLVGEVLEENDVKNYCVDAGGDMRQRSSENKALVVGLEHPADPTKIIGTVSVTNQSLCGSAGNRRVWQNFHHIINPDTLVSPQDILAVWVVAESTIIADALTTGLFFVSAEVLRKEFDFEYFLVKADYSFEKSESFKGEIFVEKHG